MEQNYTPELLQQEPAQQERVYHLNFAEDYYELPDVPVYKKPKKERKPRKKKERTSFPVILWILLIVLAIVISTVVTAVVMDQMWQERFDKLGRSMMEKDAALQEQIDDFSDLDDRLISAQIAPEGMLTPVQVYAQNWESVVAISAFRKATDSMGQSGTYQSMGSGFIITEDGYVVSNYHVVEGAERIEVTMANADVYGALLVGYDETNDVAVLKMEAEGLPFAILGSSNSLLVGDQVAAIGNPLGDLTSSITVGYVSGKDRIVTTDGPTINMIQTDAAINSGNSGGPLFNMKGEVVGITTAKFSGTSRNGVSIEGIGFAIPIDDVIGTIEELRDQGYVSEAYLGVMVMDVDPTAQAYGLPAGAFVDEVIPGYAAEAAGMLAQDIIIELDGKAITSRTELTQTLKKYKPGQTVTVTVYRTGSELQLQVTLDEKPRTENQIQSQQPQEQPQQEQPQQQPQVQPQYPDQGYLMPDMDDFEEWFQGFMEDFLG